MAKDEEVIIAMRAGQTELKKDLDDIKRTIDNKFKSYKAPTGGMFSGLKSSLTNVIAAIGGATAAFGFMKSSIQEALSARKEFAKIETAVRQTGGAAGFSAKEIKGFADELERTTGIDGGNVLNDVYAQLLTFTNIKGDNFKKAGTAILDLATVLDKTGDMKGQTIQLAKALENPIKGLSALTKTGITFTEAQESMIKSMVTAGDTAGAQGIILDEINAKYGSQAQAIYEAQGGLASFDATVKQLQESVGEAALPVIIELNKMLVGTMQKANEAEGSISTLATAFKVVGIIIAGTAGWIEGIINVMATFVGTVIALGNIVASGFSSQSFDTFEKTVKAGLKSIKDGAGDTYETLKALWDTPIKATTRTTTAPGKSGKSGSGSGGGPKGGDSVGADANKQLLDEERQFNKLMEADQAAADDAMAEQFEDSLKRKEEAYQNYFTSLKVYQDEWVSYQVAKLEEELEGYKQIGIAKEEIELMRQERLKEIEEEAFEARWELWMKQNEGFVAMGEVLQAGYESTFDAMFDSQLSGAEKVKKVFESIKSTALNVLKDILMGFILNSIKSAVVGQGQQAAAVAGAVATGSAIAAAYAPAAAMASLASFGTNAIAAQSGIASTIGMSQALATTGVGFAKGGDFIVPPGYSNDSYPIRVQSFERVQVTPANKVGQDLAMLAEIASSIKALNMNLVRKDMSVNINANIDAVKFTKDVTYKSSNKLSKSGVKQSDY